MHGKVELRSVSRAHKQQTSENYFSVRIALGLAFGRIPVILPLRYPLRYKIHFTFKVVVYSSGVRGGVWGGGVPWTAFSGTTQIIVEN